MRDHQHQFSVDAACDCGAMISKVIRALSQSNTDLLEALESTVNHHLEHGPCWCPIAPREDEPGIPHSACLDARTALRKARGESA